MGFWIFGEPFSGYVLRVNFTNYGYRYEASDGEGVFDRVEYTERRITTFFGSHSRFGPFTFAGGLGLGLELNQKERCGLARATVGGRSVVAGRSSDCDMARQQIALERNLSDRADLNGPLHPVYFDGALLGRARVLRVAAASGGRYCGVGSLTWCARRACFNRR